MGALALIFRCFLLRSSYVEKKTCEWAVQPARIAGIPWTIGAGLAEIGFTLESFTSSRSILRCSCGWGGLACIITRFSHSLGRRGSPHSKYTNLHAPSLRILKQSANALPSMMPGRLFDEPIWHREYRDRFCRRLLSVGTCVSRGPTSGNTSGITAGQCYGERQVARLSD